MPSEIEVITSDPLNAAVPLASLSGESLTQGRMYVRTSFGIPQPLPSGFDVVIPGQEDRWVSAESLVGLAQVEVTMVLECAGNGRTLMSPVPDGLGWVLGGASPITVAGVPLAAVLGDLPEDVAEVVFTGADTGTVDPQGHVPYQFSIDRDLAMSGVPVLVTHIGGEPLIPPHGAPVRLVVPGHYAMKSVKWLTRIEAVTDPFLGHFVERYRYHGDDTEPDGAPVATIAVRSIIASPADGETVHAGRVEVSGSAWSGSAPVSVVEVSTDGGETWQQANLADHDPTSRWAAVAWRATVEVEPGEVEFMVRAIDETGASQPADGRWNTFGYANNLVHRVSVEVV